MAGYIAGQIGRALTARKPGPADILVLGLAFKEDVPDLRNTKVIDVVRDLEALGHRVDVHDPVVDPQAAKHEYGQSIHATLPAERRYDAIVMAVAHATFALAFGENYDRYFNEFTDECYVTRQYADFRS
jgi:UDP-N-acetyl-D-galactosamine dehydrogenase